MILEAAGSTGTPEADIGTLLVVIERGLHKKDQGEARGGAGGGAGAGAGAGAAHDPAGVPAQQALSLSDEGHAVLRLPELSAHGLLSPLLGRQWSIVAESPIEGTTTTGEPPANGEQQPREPPAAHGVRYVLTSAAWSNNVIQA